MNPFTGAVTSRGWKVPKEESWPESQKKPFFNLERNRGYRLRVQGLIALSDCAAANGGFYCVPGAHKYMKTWAKKHKDNMVC